MGVENTHLADSLQVLFMNNTFLTFTKVSRSIGIPSYLP